MASNRTRRHLPIRALRLAPAIVLGSLAMLAATPAPAPATSRIQFPPEAQARLQEIRDQATPGQVVENVTSVYDSTQRYAIYLPTPYRADRAWPTIFLLDPRGRARIPMDLFVEAAERRGYVLISSYNTASDTNVDVNTPAMRAMLTDATALFSLDDRRFYLVGFSGTARSSWTFAGQLEQHVAGIIGFGGGLPAQVRPPQSARYAYYGAAGVTDFNYEEMQALDGGLDNHEIAHRFEYFAGGHSWGPPEVCGRAVDWMELQAMKTGLRRPNPVLVGEIYRARLAEARAYEPDEEGNPGLQPPGGEPPAYGAWWRYSAIVEDFDGLLEDGALEPIRARARALAEQAEVEDTRRRKARNASLHRAYIARYATFLQGVQEGTRSLALPEMLRDLDLRGLKQRADATDDPMDALAASRMLAVVSVRAVFYEPNAFLEAGDPVKALAMLQIAEFIQGPAFTNWLGFARAHALRGDADEAVASLEKLEAAGRSLDPASLRADRYFDGIRDDRPFVELLRRLDGSVPNGTP